MDLFLFFRVPLFYVVISCIILFLEERKKNRCYDCGSERGMWAKEARRMGSEGCSKEFIRSSYDIIGCSKASIGKWGKRVVCKELPRASWFCL